MVPGGSEKELAWKEELPHIRYTKCLFLHCVSDRLNFGSNFSTLTLPTLPFFYPVCLLQKCGQAGSARIPLTLRGAFYCIFTTDPALFLNEVRSTALQQLSSIIFYLA